MLLVSWNVAGRSASSDSTSHARVSARSRLWRNWQTPRLQVPVLRKGRGGSTPLSRISVRIIMRTYVRNDASDRACGTEPRARRGRAVDLRGGTARRGSAVNGARLARGPRPSTVRARRDGVHRPAGAFMISPPFRRPTSISSGCTLAMAACPRIRAGSSSCAFRSTRVTPASPRNASVRCGRVMPKNRIGHVGYGTWQELYSYSKSWPCLFPQHGPGRKHERRDRAD